MIQCGVLTHFKIKPVLLDHQTHTSSRSTFMNSCEVMTVIQVFREWVLTCNASN